MAGSSQCFVEWKEQFVSKERGKRVVHYFLKDISGESVLAVIGTERSVRHMFYVVAEDFLKVNEAENSITAGYRWRSRREVVNWLTSMLSKQHRQGEHLKSLRSDVSGVGVSYQNRLAKNVNLRIPDIVWSGVAWTCSKQLKHFPAFRRNGMTISVQSFVYVMAVEEVRHIAYLEDMYEDKKGQKKVKVRWFHHRQEVEAHVTLKNAHPKEIFITPIVQVISVECVDAPAIVLAREHYEKFVPILPDDLLTRVYLCLKQFKNSRLKPFKLSKLCGYFGQPIFSIMDSDFVVDDEMSPGGKRARILRGRQVITYDPSGLHMKFEMLRMKLIPKDVKNGSLEMPAFKVNEKIEVLCQDSGIRGCWFRCSVLKVSRKRIKVIYDDLKDADDIGNLEEWIPAFRSANPDKLGSRRSDRPTIRPAPSENETNVDVVFELGSLVDAYWTDGWWEGVVTGISQSEDGGVQVYVPGESMFIEVQKKNVRLSKDWVGDRWVDLKTIPDILSLVPANRSPISNETNSESAPISSEQTPIPIDLPEPIETPQEVNPETHEMEVDPVSANDEKENGPVSANDVKENGPVSACDDKDVEMGEK